MDAFRWEMSKLEDTTRAIIQAWVESTGQVRTGKYNKRGRSHDQPNSNASAVRERQGCMVVADGVESPG
jgi:hypothetical protein